jgi:biopolymer transport protein ExbD
MGMKIGGGKKGQPKPDVNVTPLVDVTLVVLIIFMVMTPLMTKSFWLNLPKKPDEKAIVTPPSKDNEPLVLTIDKSGVVRINKTIIEKGQMNARLPRMLAAKQSKVLYFDAHDQIPYGVAAELMNVTRQAGAKSIAILTKSVVPN